VLSLTYLGWCELTDLRQIIVVLDDHHDTPLVLILLEGLARQLILARNFLLCSCHWNHIVPVSLRPKPLHYKT
jgi:hypothetical protein